MSSRTCWVRLGLALSRVQILENGVPRGGVLSSALFIVKINSLKGTPTINSLLYACGYVKMSFKTCCLSSNAKYSLELINLLTEQIKMVSNLTLQNVSASYYQKAAGCRQSLP